MKCLQKKALTINFIAALFLFKSPVNPTRAESNASNKNFGKLNFMKSTSIKLLLFFAVICAYSALCFAQDSESENKYPSDRKLKILERPVPRLTEEQRAKNICVQGQVVLRVEFLSNSEIGNITVVRPLSHGLAENAIEAAKIIKFEPEIKDGIVTTVFKLVQYNFEWGWTNTSKKNEESSENTKKDKSQQP